jgi:UDP-galactopyranose mutase
MMPRCIYETFVKGYSEKQWGVPLDTLSPALAGRFEVRGNDDPRLKLHRYQGIPELGYASWMAGMLRGIPLTLNFDFVKNKNAYAPRVMTVFTGPIDEYFGYEFGKLKYRGQRREHTYHPDAEFLLPCGQVNNPSNAAGAHVRTLEWKHMMPPDARKRIKGTVLTTETPFTPESASDYEYPFPDEENQKLYRRYRERAALEPRLLVCGRLGEYRYYDMDQAIGRALMIADRLIGAGRLAASFDIRALDDTCEGERKNSGAD